MAETCIETCIGSMKRSLFSVVGDVGRCPKMASRGQQGQDNAGGVFRSVCVCRQLCQCRKSGLSAVMSLVLLALCNLCSKYLDINTLERDMVVQAHVDESSDEETPT